MSTLISRDELISDINMYMRSDGILTDAQELIIAEKVITAVGDDDSNYAEILCKSLKNIALINKAKASNLGSHKAIRTDELWEEFYHDISGNSWDIYLDSLDDVCAAFGYTELDQFITGMMTIKVSADTPIIDDPPIDVNDISNTSSNSTTEYVL